MKLNLASAFLFVAAFALSGCLQPTSNIFRNDVDAVTGRQTITSNYVSFLEDAGIFGIVPNGISIAGKIVNGTDYLTINYTSENWLFMNNAQFRFDDGETVYTIPLRRVSRNVNGNATISEWVTVPASSTTVARFISEVERRSILAEPSRLYVKLEGQDYYRNGYADLPVGDISLGAFYRYNGDAVAQ